MPWCCLRCCGPDPLPLAAPADSGEANLVFVGDIMVAEIPGELIAKGIDPFQPFESFLRCPGPAHRQPGMRGRHDRQGRSEALHLPCRSAGASRCWPGISTACRWPTTIPAISARMLSPSNWDCCARPACLISAAATTASRSAQALDRRAQRAAHRLAGLRGIQAALVRSQRHAAGRGLERRGRPGDQRHHRGASGRSRRPGHSLHALGLGGRAAAQRTPARILATRCSTPAPTWWWAAIRT